MPNTTIPAHAFPDDLRALSESEAAGPSPRAKASVVIDEMRSSSKEIVQLVLQLSVDEPDQVDTSKGVGGRCGFTPSPREGGRVPKNREIFEIRTGVKKSVDPRLEELATMGLADYWLQVAEYLGVDAFLGMWRILDANRGNIPQTKGNGGNSMSPSLRPYSGYLRFQKNRFVENLAAQGIPPKEIQRRVQAQLCEKISIVHIWRLAKKNKIKS